MWGCRAPQAEALPHFETVSFNVKTPLAGGGTWIVASVALTVGDSRRPLWAHVNDVFILSIRYPEDREGTNRKRGGRHSTPSLRILSH